MKPGPVARSFALFLVVLVTAVAIVACASGKSAVAEATYLGQQLECVDRHETREAIDRCRAEVRARWGIAEPVTDAATDAASEEAAHAPDG